MLFLTTHKCQHVALTNVSTTLGKRNRPKLEQATGENEVNKCCSVKSGMNV